MEEQIQSKMSALERIDSENLAPVSDNHPVENKNDVCCNGQASAHTNAGSNREGRQLLLESEPETKRSKIPVFEDLMASKQARVIKNIFYKTKLCYQFQIGTCPYTSNCNFAHSYEELREEPYDWQEIVIAHREKQVASPELNEKFQITSFGASDERLTSYAETRCKLFLTRKGCPYGDKCKYLHEEEFEVRESEAICLLPGTGDGYGCNENKSTLDHSNWKTNHGHKATLDHSKWKTKTCYRWQLNGYCPYGSRCHFAHGPAELRPYVAQLVDKEVEDSSGLDTKQGAGPAKSSTIVASGVSGAPSRSLPYVMQKTGKRPRSWKGPDKISKIYGDWIDDLQ